MTAKKQLFIKTYGCQMNVYDSNRMADILNPLGFESTEDLSTADMAIYNTCHIREKAAEKLFVSSVKKQILSISDKYIIPWTTLDQAFLFLPAEAIFAEINAYYPSIIEFGQKHNVSIVSPTTLMAMLSIVANAIRSLETQKHAQVIQTELVKLSSDFSRFEDRWNKFTKDFKSVGKDIDNIDITNQKIISRFSGIERLELSE